MPEVSKKIFLSYSHEDRVLAESLARELHALGEEVWFDNWEISLGDSLVDKIFEEGLSNAAAFVVVLSDTSVASKWVRSELDVATVRRIEGVTRVIPALAGELEIPQSLRALQWVDLRRGVTEAAAQIRDSVHGISRKPERSERASLGSSIADSVAGLSRAATEVALLMVRSSDDEGQEPSFGGQDIVNATRLEPLQVNDAVEELEERGAAKILRTIGTGPFNFYQVEPTHITFWDLAPELDYDPVDDVRLVTTTVVSLNKAVRGKELSEETGLKPGRLNRVVARLDDNGLADVSKGMGTFPFAFRSVAPTRLTRQFVDGHQ